MRGVRGAGWFVAAAVMVVGCREAPLAPDAALPGRVASLTAFPPCTRNFMAGPLGSPLSWRPIGLPDTTDVACIDAPGSYVVTTSFLNVRALVLGGTGSSPVLRLKGTGLTEIKTRFGVVVKPGAVLSVDSAVGPIIEAPTFEVGGTMIIHSAAIAPMVKADSAIITGRLTVDSITAFFELSGGQCFRNTGDVTLHGAMTRTTLLFISLADGCTGRIEGGTLESSYGDLIVTGPRLIWTGGRVVSHDGQSVGLLAITDTLSLASPYLTGPVTFTPPDTTAPQVNGVVGPGLTLTLNSVAGIELVSGPSHGPLLVFGRLETMGNGRATGAIVNWGTVTVGTLAGFRLQLDSLVNHDSLLVKDRATFDAATGLLWNRGIIVVPAGDTLELAAGNLLAGAGSVQTGLLWLTGGTLTGSGTMGDVFNRSGTVAPGNPIGTLTATSYTQEAGGSLVVEIAGQATGSFDQLKVGGAATVAGTLDLREVPPFLSGSCGQYLPVVTDLSQGGSFGTLLGAAPGVGRGWRVFAGTDTLFLAGHDPALPVSLAPATLGVAEGGASAGYNLCLRAAPVANATVAPTSAGGQLAALTPVVFTPAAWSRPLPVTVSAVNDALPEPPPQLATISHGVTSADPALNGANPGSVSVTIADNDGSASLELALLSAAPTVTVGSPFTVTARILNAGPDPSTGTSFTLPATTGFGYLSSTGTLGCTSSPITGTTCSIADIPAGGRADLSVTFTALVAGSYPTTFTAGTIQFDANLTNNSKVQTILVN